MRISLTTAHIGRIYTPGGDAMFMALANEMRDRMMSPARNVTKELQATFGSNARIAETAGYTRAKKGTQERKDYDAFMRTLQRTAKDANPTGPKAEVRGLGKAGANRLAHAVPSDRADLRDALRAGELKIAPELPKEGHIIMSWHGGPEGESTLAFSNEPERPRQIPETKGGPDWFADALNDPVITLCLMYAGQEPASGEGYLTMVYES